MAAPDISERLRTLRGLLQFTQVDFARLAGVDSVTVYKWEAGIHEPPLWLAGLLGSKAAWKSVERGAWGFLALALRVMMERYEKRPTREMPPMYGLIVTLVMIRWEDELKKILRPAKTKAPRSKAQ